MERKAQRTDRAPHNEAREAGGKNRPSFESERRKEQIEKEGKEHPLKHPSLQLSPSSPEGLEAEEGRDYTETER